MHSKRIAIGSRCWRLVASFVVALTLFVNSASAQNLLWAKRAGGTGSDDGFAVAADAAGNTYVSGLFFGSATFGQGDPNQTTLSPDGGFLAKYSPTGSLVWAKRMGGRPFAVVVDAAGNSHVVGDFSGSQSFGAGGTLNSAGGTDIFIAKYDTSGTLIWAKRAGNNVDDLGLSIALDAAGNSYITGGFGGTAGGAAVFGQGEANQTSLTAASIFQDMFVAKYNSDGLLQWARRAGGSAVDRGSGIAVDGSGNSYVAGSIFGSATFGPGEANQTILPGDTFGDIFIAKYNSSGALLWAKRAGGTGADSGLSVGLDSSGNAYITGVFNGTAFFDALPVISSGFSDFFIAKYNPNGVAQWVKRGGGTASENGGRVAVNGAGNTYVIGSFGGSATFGQGEPNQTTLMSAGGSDAFIVRYDSTGALQWAIKAGGVGNDFGNGIAVDGAGNVHVAGQFEGMATFGQSPGNQATLNSDGGWDIFAARFAGGPILLECATNSLQSALDQSAPGASILVNGTCSENLLVRNEKQRITIDGSGTATINAQSNGSPALNVRGKGILIQNFTITGGSVGVYINRGSNAVLNTNVIENSAGNGVVIDELAFAVLINNTMRNHSGAGVFVSENSTARIGFNSDSDTSASTNFIYENGLGIVVSNGSSARIVGNTIDSNTGDAIQVLRDSYAEISSNQIFTNGGDGIEVGENSIVQLGEDSGTNIYESPNASTNANQGFAVRCINGGVADGRLGTLNGIAGVKSFSDPTCIDSLN